MGSTGVRMSANKIAASTWSISTGMRVISAASSGVRKRVRMDPVFSLRRR